MMNGDFIRQMSDEELAEYLAEQFATGANAIQEYRAMNAAWNGCERRLTKMPEVRLIDANAASDKIMRETVNHADDLGMIGIALMIGFARMMRDENDFPTIEAEPVRHGRWEKSRSYSCCSECGAMMNLPWYWYCGKCGARMDGGESSVLDQ